MEPALDPQSADPKAAALVAELFCRGQENIKSKENKGDKKARLKVKKAIDAMASKTEYDHEQQQFMQHNQQQRANHRMQWEAYHRQAKAYYDQNVCDCESHAGCMTRSC